MNSAEVPQSNAADEYEADLEASNEGPMKSAVRWAAGLVDAFFGGDGSEVMGAAVVVHRLDNNAEVLRLGAGTIEEAESLVAMVRADLEELSHEDFLDRWGGRDSAEPVA